MVLQLFGRGTVVVMEEDSLETISLGCYKRLPQIG